MTHDSWLEQAELYAAGALAGAERKSFERHLASGCGECATCVGNAETALAQMAAASVRSAVPPASVKAKLMARVDAEGPLHFSGWALLGAGLAAAAMIWVLPWKEAWLSKQHANLPQAMIHAPGETHVVELAKFGKHWGRGKVVWNPAADLVWFGAKDLSQLPKGKVFELWAVGESGPPVSLGTFSTDDKGEVNLYFPAQDKKQFHQFAVTIEPTGGMPEPTGPTRLAGGL